MNVRDRVAIQHEALSEPATATVVARGFDKTIVLLDGTGQVVTVPTSWTERLEA